MFSLQTVVLCFATISFQEIASHNTTGTIAEVSNASSAEENELNGKSARDEDKQSLVFEDGNECNENKSNAKDLNLKFKVRKRDASINELFKKSISVLRKANVEGEDEKMKMTFHHKKRNNEAVENLRRAHPYVVLIELKEKDRRVSVCSGTLIALQWVITAAHCFNLTYTSGSVYAGGSSLAELEDETTLAEGSQQVDTKKLTVHTHPLFDPSRKTHYDVALVQIWYGGFKQTVTVRPVGFSLNYWRHRTYRNCQITDFGPDQQTASFDEVALFSRQTHYLLVDTSCRCFDESRDRLMLCSKTNRTVHGGICSAVSGGGLICDGLLVAVAAGYQTVKDVDTCEMDAHVRQDCANVPDRTFTTFHQLCPYVEWISSTVKSLDSHFPLDSQCYEFHESAGNGDGPEDDRLPKLSNVDTTTSSILILAFSLQLLFLTGI